MWAPFAGVVAYAVFAFAIAGDRQGGLWYASSTTVALSVLIIGYQIVEALKDLSLRLGPAPTSHKQEKTEQPTRVGSDLIS